MQRRGVQRSFAALRRSGYLLDRIVAQADAGLPRHQTAALVNHVVVLSRIQGDTSSDTALAALSTRARFLESRGIAVAEFDDDSGLGHRR
ncbi:MAG TPA: hypothetical protein VN153_09040 [Tahibacter sp.]|nr:hypothetical protein [Tahibacter sp.]